MIHINIRYESTNGLRFRQDFTPNSRSDVNNTMANNNMNIVTLIRKYAN